MSVRLALGTVQFGLEYGVANRSGQVTLADVGGLLAYAHESGVDTLDTAIAYGESESVLGRVGVAAWNIVTKLPPVPEGCADVSLWVHEQIDASLGRLGVERAYAVLLHRPAQLFDANGPQLLAALEQLKTQGRTEKIGVSVYAPEELSRLFALRQFDLVQAPLNILDRRLIESGWASKLKQEGVELHTRSAFLQGLLLMPPAERPAKFERWSSLWREWDEWLKISGLTPLEACLHYALSVSEIDKVIVGVDSLAQMKQILLAANAYEPMPIPNWSAHVEDALINPAAWNTL